MKILHLEADKYSEESLRKIQNDYDLTILNCSDQEMLYKHLENKNYSAIFTRLGLNIDEKCLNLQPQLKYIITPTTGINHIDYKSANKKEIEIISLKGEYEFLAGIKSTAEHTWGLLLTIIRRIPDAINKVREGKWERLPFLSDELDNKTIGIIGFGRLGQIVAGYANAFNMKVLVYEKEQGKSFGKKNVRFCGIEELLEKADYIILLISYSEENELFFDEKKFKKVKRGAYFINTSRGELVDELALVESLKSGKIKAAALDVLSGDSVWSDTVDKSNPLIQYALNHNNLYITPHMGGYGIDSIRRTRDFITDKFLNRLK